MHVRAFFTAVATSLIVLLATWGFDRSERERYRDGVRFSAVTFVANLNEILHHEITSHLSVLQSIRSVWQAHDDGIEKIRFERYAKAIITGHDATVRSIQLAPDGIITYVYPREGNEAVIGLNILSHATQGEEARRSVETREVVVIGPINLIQGGQGLIARLPLFVQGDRERERFWGFATVVIDLPPVWRTVSARLSGSGFEVAVRKAGANGKPGEAFFGDDQIFRKQPVLETVNLPGRKWEIGIAPIGGWPWISPLSGLIWGLGGFIAALVGLLVYGQLMSNNHLRRARDEAEHANRAKSAFLANMSHELRTPMNAIIGYGDMLEHNIKGPLNDGQREYLSYIRESAQHLLKLINQVLELAKVESGTMEPRLVAQPACRIIDNAIHFIQAQAAVKDVRIETETGAIGPEEKILVDDLFLNQALINLLGNAVKFTERGGSIAVRCSRGEGEGIVRICVVDNGPGIPEDQQGHIFTPFDRLAFDRSTVEGSGIGLAITRNLVEAMGGRIGFVSELGRGSTFWIDLPRA
ncbi:MAG: ATP-binding protein [Rhodospirillales bacterium]|nr:ATP-binding protein [Rhodospirillales bacterium]